MDITFCSTSIDASFGLEGSSFSDTNTPVKHTIERKIQKNHIKPNHLPICGNFAHATIVFLRFSPWFRRLAIVIDDLILVSFLEQNKFRLMIHLFCLFCFAAPNRYKPRNADGIRRAIPALSVSGA